MTKACDAVNGELFDARVRVEIEVPGDVQTQLRDQTPGGDQLKAVEGDLGVRDSQSVEEVVAEV